MNYISRNAVIKLIDIIHASIERKVNTCMCVHQYTLHWTVLYLDLRHAWRQEKLDKYLIHSHNSLYSRTI